MWVYYLVEAVIEYKTTGNTDKIIKFNNRAQKAAICLVVIMSLLVGIADYV